MQERRRHRRTRRSRRTVDVANVDRDRLSFDRERNVFPTILFNFLPFFLFFFSFLKISSEILPLFPYLFFFDSIRLRLDDSRVLESSVRTRLRRKIDVGNVNGATSIEEFDRATLLYLDLLVSIPRARVRDVNRAIGHEILGFPVECF